MGKLENTFSWSVTRNVLFRDCQRAYFYQYYGMWNGWNIDAPENVRKAYVLSKMTNLVFWAGIIVHDTIRMVLEAVKNGESLPRLEEIQERARQTMRSGWKQAVDRLWFTDPKRNVNLFELYYGNGKTLPAEVTNAFKTRIFDALEGFYYSSALKELLAVGPNNWLPIDTLDTFDLNGTKIYCAPDAAYKSEDGRLHILDWKTGGENPAAIRFQLGCYALYAMGKWNIDKPESILASGVYLNDGGRSREYFMDEALITQTRETILASISAMKAKLRNADQNVAEIEDFQPCGDYGVCENCRFRELCQQQ